MKSATALRRNVASEIEWVKHIATMVRKAPWLNREHISVETGLKLAYGSEILSYGGASDQKTIGFETDLALVESVDGDRWQPRVVIEAKLATITTHDAITYSQKAAAHRSVHPYLRYGIMLGDRQNHPLPGRLYRHGAQFDFMMSFRDFVPSKKEASLFLRLLRMELQASRTLEKLLYESRRRDRDCYMILHRKLRVVRLQS